MNKFVVLIFSLSAYYSPSTGRPDPQFSTIYPTKPPSLNKQKDTPSSSHIVFFEHEKQIKEPAPHHAAVPRNTFNVRGRNCTFGFCEDVEEYPSDYILSILNQTNAFDKLFNKFVPVIGDRTSEAENICSSVMSVKYPKTGKNIEDKIRIIANLDKYKQGFAIETCRENAVCDFKKDLPYEIQTTCTQRYTQLTLLALDDSNKPTMDIFPAPSCCVCMYRKA